MKTAVKVSGLDGEKNLHFQIYDNYIAIFKSKVNRLANN